MRALMGLVTLELAEASCVASRGSIVKAVIKLSNTRNMSVESVNNGNVNSLRQHTYSYVRNKDFPFLTSSLSDAGICLIASRSRVPT